MKSNPSDILDNFVTRWVIHEYSDRWQRLASKNQWSGLIQVHRWINATLCRELAPTLQALRGATDLEKGWVFGPHPTPEWLPLEQAWAKDSEFVLMQAAIDGQAWVRGHDSALWLCELPPTPHLHRKIAPWR